MWNAFAIKPCSNTNNQNPVEFACQTGTHCVTTCRQSQRAHRDALYAQRSHQQKLTQGLRSVWLKCRICVSNCVAACNVLKQTRWNSNEPAFLTPQVFPFCTLLQSPVQFLSTQKVLKNITTTKKTYTPKCIAVYFHTTKGPERKVRG